MSASSPTVGTAPSKSASSALWAITVLTLLATCGIGGYVIYDLHFGERPGFLLHGSAPPVLAARRAQDRVGEPIRLAGSGTNLPLTQLLVSAYLATRPDAQAVVHPSIGSAGGIRALVDGVVDVALVSRPLDLRERQLGLVVVPYARTAVVVATHASVPESGLSAARVLELFGGRRASWTDGSRVVLLLREPGDSSQRAMSQALPGFAEALDEALHSGIGQILYSDLDMQSALINTRGAVGLFDLGAVICQRLPLHVLALDGVEPTVGNVASGRYRFFKDLAFVLAGPPSERVAALLESVFSSEGHNRIRAAGYLPLERRER